MLSSIVEARPVPAPAPSSSRSLPFVSHVDGVPHAATREEDRLTVHGPQDSVRSHWSLRENGKDLRLEWCGPCAGEPDEPHLLAALDAAFCAFPRHGELVVAAPMPRATRLVQAGVLLPVPGAQSRVHRDMLWQHPALWLPEAPAHHALRYEMSQGRRHPHRPPSPTGTVYRRHIPWLGKTLSLRAIDIERDLPLFHRWMNDPVVGEFWQEQGDLAKHRAYLGAIAADPRVSGLVGCFDGEPFGYFEVYWAKEDRIAPFCDADDFDRGWHVLVGEPRFRGQGFLKAWMPSLSHYLFLADCRTQRIVIEPRADNHRMIRSLARCGYALVKEFDFPHKRAMLGTLLRERFFGEALWLPQPDRHASA